MLRPPYAVEVRGSNVTIVPARYPSADPARALCTINPYLHAYPAEVGDAIVARLNAHDALVDSLTAMLRHFGPRADGQKFTALQKASLLQAVAVLKSVHQT